MKTLSTALAAHYAGNAHSLATLWKITRADGLVFGFTDHDQPLTHSGTTYTPSSAYDASAVNTSAELNVDNMETAGVLDADGITAADLEAGLWDGAAVEIVEVNWRDLSMGENVLRVGTLGEVERNGPTYRAELRGLMHALQNSVGRIVKPACDADLGDARCTVDLDGSPGYSTAGTVASAASARVFDSTSAAVLAFATGYFDYGTVRWTSGLNAGLRMEIKSHTYTGSPGTDATLTLQLAMPYAIGGGDAFVLQPGCDKTKATCIAKFNNLVNFRGFSFVPGQDKVLLVGGQ